MSHTCFIGLGSNLDSPCSQLQRAANALREHSAIQSLTLSPLYQSKAVGPGKQDDYLNAVACFTTSLPPHSLLALLQSIENNHDRKREIRWGARTLDLDILLYDALEIDDATLTIPHPRMQDRSFVLLPLYDLAPDLILPNGQALSMLIANTNNDDIKRSKLRW